MSIFSILNHPCSFMVYYYLFGVFLSKLLFSGFLQFPCQTRYSTRVYEHRLVITLRMISASHRSVAAFWFVCPLHAILKILKHCPLFSQQPLRMRIKVMYKVNGAPVNEQGEVNSFPPGLWRASIHRQTALYVEIIFCTVNAYRCVFGNHRSSWL